MKKLPVQVQIAADEAGWLAARKVHDLTKNRDRQDVYKFVKLETDAEGTERLVLVAKHFSRKRIVVEPEQSFLAVFEQHPFDPTSSADYYASGDKERPELIMRRTPDGVIEVVDARRYTAAQRKASRHSITKWKDLRPADTRAFGGTVVFRSAVGYVHSGAIPSLATVDVFAYAEITDGTPDGANYFWSNLLGVNRRANNELWISGAYRKLGVNESIVSCGVSIERETIGGIEQDVPHLNYVSMLLQTVQTYPGTYNVEPYLLRVVTVNLVTGATTTTYQEAHGSYIHDWYTLGCSAPANDGRHVLIILPNAETAEWATYILNMLTGTKELVPAKTQTYAWAYDDAVKHVTTSCTYNGTKNSQGEWVSGTFSENNTEALSGGGGGQWFNYVYDFYPGWSQDDTLACATVTYTYDQTLVQTANGEYNLNGGWSGTGAGSTSTATASSVYSSSQSNPTDVTLAVEWLGRKVYELQWSFMTTEMTNSSSFSGDNNLVAACNPLRYTGTYNRTNSRNYRIVTRSKGIYSGNIGNTVLYADQVNDLLIIRVVMIDDIHELTESYDATNVHTVTCAGTTTEITGEGSRHAQRITATLVVDDIIVFRGGVEVGRATITPPNTMYYEHEVVTTYPPTAGIIAYTPNCAIGSSSSSSYDVISPGSSYSSSGNGDVEANASPHQNVTMGSVAVSRDTSAIFVGNCQANYIRATNLGDNTGAHVWFYKSGEREVMLHGVATLVPTYSAHLFSGDKAPHPEFPDDAEKGVFPVSGTGELSTHLWTPIFVGAINKRATLDSPV